MRFQKSIFTLVVLLIAFSCKRNEPDYPQESGRLNFSFSVNSPSGGRLETQIPSAFIISLRNSAGELIYELEEFSLVFSGDTYITSEISMMVGQYTVESFLVKDENGETIYIAPKEGSELAPLVNNPLPISFSVSAEATTQVQIEVLDASIGEPLQFGYSVFSFEIVNSLEVGLLAHFNFNGSANDISGNGFSGIVSGAQLTANRNGTESSAYIFDGQNDYIETDISDSDLEGLEAVSFGAWVKFESFSNSRQELISNTDDRNGLIMSRIAEMNVFNSGVSTDIDNSNEFWYRVLLGEAEVDRWYHLMTVYNGETLKYFVNGVLSSTITAEGLLERTGFATTDYPVILGGNGSLRSDSFLNGVLDDVRIYSRALTDREVYILGTD